MYVCMYKTPLSYAGSVPTTAIRQPTASCQTTRILRQTAYEVNHSGSMQLTVTDETQAGRSCDPQCDGADCHATKPMPASTIRE